MANKNPVRVVMISDTHGKQRDMRLRPIPEGDILIHAGDLIRDHNDMREYYDINRFFQEQKSFKHKLFIAGNHDWGFQREKQLATELMHGATYLQDQFVEIKGLKIYGTPWQPEFCNWAFNLPRMGNKLQAAWEMIPDDTDVLITHGPPHGIQDKIHMDEEANASYNQHLGCELLMRRVEQIKPMIHVFGHIHGGYGTQTITWDNGQQTIFVNAAICTERYEPLNTAIVADIFPRVKNGKRSTKNK
jgi:Icc-related predicted phosphoesterase